MQPIDALEQIETKRFLNQLPTLIKILLTCGFKIEQDTK